MCVNIENGEHTGPPFDAVSENIENSVNTSAEI